MCSYVYDDTIHFEVYGFMENKKMYFENKT